MSQFAIRVAWTSAFVFAFCVSVFAQNEHEIDLRVGEQTTVSSRGVRSFSEGTPGIIDVRVPPDAEQFVIVGMRPGETSLLLLHERGRQTKYVVRVYEPGSGDSSSSGVIRVPERVNVRLDFYFAGLTERYSHQIGVGWPGTVGGAGVGGMSASFNLQSGSLTGATASLVNQPLPRLDIAQTEGWAKVYRHAVLIAGNGHQSQFTNGGEVNITVQGALTAEIRSIEFGSDIRVKPRYDEKSGRIEMMIQADVSDLEDTNDSGLPNRSRSTLQTLVTVENGQGIVLAGLAGQRKRRSRTGLPGLSQIPIFGLLFGSDSEASEENDTLLFIVPSIVKNIPRNQQDLVTEALDIYREFDGDVLETKLGERALSTMRKENHVDTSKD
ncbi:MAG: pilus assembly protein N-terminal domain-containing protein [Myxococcales bacterium]|nr:MAG: pilus assembly protein N-terminal domain-containing protein [Myxococcales bacterium]